MTLDDWQIYGLISFVIVILYLVIYAVYNAFKKENYRQCTRERERSDAARYNGDSRLYMYNASAVTDHCSCGNTSVLPTVGRINQKLQ